MSTGFSGDSYRLYQWMAQHYIVRGGPMDPVLQTSGNAGSIAGGYLAYNSVVTLPPVSGTQTPPAVPLPRTQSMISTGTFTVGTAALASNGPPAGGTGFSASGGGIYIGTIPGGAWINSVEIFCYSALATGNATSVGVFWSPATNTTGGAAPGYQPSTLYCLGYITTPAASTLYTSQGIPTANNITLTGATRALLTGFVTGPGTGPSGSTWPTVTGATLASDGPPGGQGFAGQTQSQTTPGPTPGDIDLYFVNFLIAGGGGTTPNTAGNFQCKVEFTGLVG